MARKHRSDSIYASAAELFGVLATPVRLQVIHALSQTEKNVSELLALIDTTQPNLSQHLSTLYFAGIVARERRGQQVYYRLQSPQVAALCRTVCDQMSGEFAPAASVASSAGMQPAAVH